MKTETTYRCNNCGQIFDDPAECKEHEDRCKHGDRVVKIWLTHGDGGYRMETHFYNLLVEDDEDFAEIDGFDKVFDADGDCDYFVIQSKDVSPEHIKEMKSELVRFAVEWTERARRESSEYYTDLLKKLKGNLILDESREE